MMESRSQLGAQHPLRRFFGVLTERNFYEQLGWPDHRVIRYVADLLETDFADANRVYPSPNELGPRPSGIADLLLAAETGTSGLTERNAHRHIGDFTLFMMGLFPEHLTRLNTQLVSTGADALLDYVKVGKRSYRLVAELPTKRKAERTWHCFGSCRIALSCASPA
jgi:hypothetical protein